MLILLISLAWHWNWNHLCLRFKIKMLQGVPELRKVLRRSASRILQVWAFLRFSVPCAIFRAYCHAKVSLKCVWNNLLLLHILKQTKSQLSLDSFHFWIWLRFPGEQVQISSIELPVSTQTNDIFRFSLHPTVCIIL